MTRSTYDFSGTVDIVPLGHRLDAEGRATPVLVRRLEAAYRLGTKSHARFIVTGGSPRRGHTEASVMREYLLEHGVPASRILTESHSSSTLENALNVKAMDIHNPIVVTSPYHAQRAEMIFSRVYGRPIRVVEAPADPDDAEEQKLIRRASAQLKFTKMMLAWKGL